MTNKVTIPVFDITTFNGENKVMNSIETASKNTFQHFKITSEHKCHDNLFQSDVIEYELIKPNMDDIFLIQIGQNIYLRKIVIEKNLFRFEPVLDTAKDHTVIVDKTIENLKIYGKFKRKILVLNQPNGEE